MTTDRAPMTTPGIQGRPFTSWMSAQFTKMLDTPRVEAHLRAPHTGALFLDTGDGVPGSDEDLRCDRCEAVTSDGLHLIQQPFFTQPRRYVVGMGLMELIREASVILVIALCSDCAEQEGEFT